MRRLGLLLITALLTGMPGRAFDVSLKVVEELDSLDMGDVKVSMLRNDSVGVQALTDGFGIAMIKNLEKGEYLLSLEKDGFYPVSALVNLRGDADLGTFAMTSTSIARLDEVIVEGARVTDGVSKITVRPLKETISSSLNSFDVLRKMNLNGLSVNPVSGLLSIYGKAAVLQVDGMVKSIDYVMSLDPARIEKIEYSDNPTARYMQSDVGGVINIILKRVERGGSVYAQGYVYPTSFILGGKVMTTYNHKDSEFSLSVSDQWNNIKGRAPWSTLTEIYKGDDGYRLERKSDTKSPNTYNYTSVNFTYQYQNRKGWLLNVEGGASFSKGWKYDNSEISTNGSGAMRGVVHQQYKNFLPSLNVYARKQSDSWKLEMIAGASMTNSSNLRDNREETSDGIYITSRDRKSKNPSAKVEVRFTRDLPRKLGNWEVGLKEDFTHADNDYGIYGLDKWNHSLTYGYAAATLEAGKFGASANVGLGYDYSKSDYARQYTWQPSYSLDLQYSVIEGLNINGNVSYRPTYPTISQLSNIEDPVKPGVVSSGNDALKTGHWIFGDIRMSYRKGNFNIILSAHNWHFKNPINSIVEYCGNGEFVHRPYNMKNKNWTNISIYASYNRLFNHLDISGQLQYNINRANNGYTINKSKNLVPVFSLSAYWGNFYIYANWYGEQYSTSGFSWNRVSHQVSLSLAYSIPHWKFIIDLSGIGYGHDGVHNRTETSSPFYDSRSISRQPYTGNQISIGVSYDLQFGRSYQRRGKGLSGSYGEETTVNILDGTKNL